MSLSFLNPYALWGLLTVIGPILIHLRPRQPANTKPLASYQFLSSESSLSKKRVRIWRLYLLLLRLLMVIALVTAASLPRIHWAMDSFDEAPAIVLVDPQLNQSKQQLLDQLAIDKRRQYTEASWY